MYGYGTHYRKGERMTDQEIKELAEQALHQACAYMQDAIGVKTGDFAVLYFTSEILDDIHATFAQYIEQEIEYRRAIRED